MAIDEDKRRGVKGGIDKDDARKNRISQKVELRKAKRDEGLQKRRNMQVVSVEPAVDVSDAAAASTPTEPQSFPDLVQHCLGFVARNGPAEEYNEALLAVRTRRRRGRSPSAPIHPPLAPGVSLRTFGLD